MSAGVVVLLLALGATAQAEDKERAREAYHRASQHYDLGEYVQALDDFKEAYRNYEDPAFLFNIAQCHRALNHKQDAVTFYKSYLRKTPQAPNRDEVQKTVAQLESAISQERAAASSPPMDTMPPSNRPADAEPSTAPSNASPPALTEPAQPTAPVLVATPSPPTEKPPIYKRWWLWTAVGVVAVGVVTGVALGVTLGEPKNPTATIAQVPGP